jgi:hypothetical protein
MHEVWQDPSALLVCGLPNPRHPQYERGCCLSTSGVRPGTYSEQQPYVAIKLGDVGHRVRCDADHWPDARIWAMSSFGEPKVNEWAMVVKQHCDAAAALGHVVLVQAIEPAEPGTYLVCCGCGAKFSQSEVHALTERAGEENLYWPLHWLKRLPPPEFVRSYDDAWKHQPTTAGRNLDTIREILKSLSEQ